MTEAPAKTRSATLAKGLQILSFLGSVSEPQSLRQVMDGLGMTKPTAHRLLATLIDHGMVRFDSDGNTYRPGMRLFELSRQVWQDFDLRGSAVPEMQKLHAMTGETISLAIPTPDGGVYIDELQSSHHLREQSRIGQRVSKWNSAIGKALVSGLSYDERVRLQESEKTQTVSNGQYTDLSELNHHLDLVNARGYAIDLDEDVQGISSVAAPIVDHRGITVAAIGLSGSSQRLDRDTLHRLGPAVIEATRLASLQAGGAPRPVSSAPMPANLPEPKFDILADVQNLIGESPVRSLDGQFIYWVDICRPCIFAHDLTTKETSRYPQKEMITAISDTKRGLLVAGLSGIRIMDLPTGQTTTTLGNPEAHKPTNRFNDGKCDNRGRFWIGSLAFNLEKGAGSLYRIDPDGSSHTMESGLSLPNGMGWSRDNRTMYLIDTADRVVFAYDFDEQSGGIGNRRPLIEFDDGCIGSPDGMDIDVDGNLWLAIWDGWRVQKHAPDGKLLAQYSVPFPRPTSCLCLDEDYDKVIVSSARIRVSNDLLQKFPLAGGLIALPKA
ncbi:MAG: SMP-30/gluconolactonase/LRE family protein [Hyphomicrobiales bacterium]|nr:SMP-30/gluconolactonase/LRE family protein [Hyphomicrobiales bacterium]